MRLNLLPRERRFYVLFEQDIANIVAAAAELTALLRDTRDPAERQQAIKQLEHEGDELTHELVRTLNRTFVTPFDREDIYALASGLDDVLDYINDAANTVVIYGISLPNEAGGKLGELIQQATGELQQAIGKLESLKDLERHWIEVNSIENRGDEVERGAVGELFRSVRDPIELMKLKELYELLEACLDRCEDVANVIENIVIKNA